MIRMLSSFIAKYGVPLFFIALFIIKLPVIKKAYTKWKNSFKEDEDEDEEKKEETAAEEVGEKKE